MVIYQKLSVKNDLKVHPIPEKHVDKWSQNKVIKDWGRIMCAANYKVLKLDAKYIYIYKVRSGTEQYGQQRTITIHCNG